MGKLQTCLTLCCSVLTTEYGKPSHVLQRGFLLFGHPIFVICFLLQDEFLSLKALEKLESIRKTFVIQLLLSTALKILHSVFSNCRMHHSSTDQLASNWN